MKTVEELKTVAVELIQLWHGSEEETVPHAFLFKPDNSEMYAVTCMVPPAQVCPMLAEIAKKNGYRSGILFFETWIAKGIPGDNRRPVEREDRTEAVAIMIEHPDGFIHGKIDIDPTKKEGRLSKDVWWSDSNQEGPSHVTGRMTRFIARNDEEFDDIIAASFGVRIHRKKPA